VLRFAGFELDQQRAELRGPDGGAIKLRPKTFDMLRLFAANAGRVLSKQELMTAVWPGVHVGEDSLFQCIREIRTALGDDQRQIVKLVSGRGYLFEAEVMSESAANAVTAQAIRENSVEKAPAVAELAKTGWPRIGLRGPVALATIAGLGFGLAIAAPIFGPGLLFPRTPPTIVVMPIVDASNDRDVAAMAADVTERLIDGLAKIENVRVVASRPVAAGSSAKAASAPPAADFVVTTELDKSGHAWAIQARMVKTATKEIQPIASITVDAKDSDQRLQESRLTAGIGHPLALRLNTLLNGDARPAASTNGSALSGSAKVAIEQATASIMQTTRERFAVAQTMLEKALADDPGNVDLAVALAALQMRGIQMVWYSPADSITAEKNAKSMLERVLRAKPGHIPALEAYCRFLNATNEFAESLVVCARTLNFDPWNGLALYHIGVAQLQLGRFEDALATFKQADRFDTPAVSRWTWLLGVGWSYVMMGRDQEALPWLERSIAITPASGRPLMLLAAAYQRVGRTEEAKAALARALAIRPGSTVSNIALPPKNSSPIFLESARRIGQAMIAAGLPER
jgi:DNA-binding winged helix-turn-helix (wHTH) protein/tetratricopeptide (TPR) repeat protein/TolB-like protein